MCLEAYSDPTHTELKQIMWRWLIQNHYYPQLEKVMPSGRIADVYVETQQGAVIIECKTKLIPSLVDAACTKYMPHCNYLFIAAPEYYIKQVAAEKRSPEWKVKSDDVGYIAIANYGVSRVTLARWRLAASPCANGGAPGGLLLSRAERHQQSKSPLPG